MPYTRTSNSALRSVFAACEVLIGNIKRRSAASDTKAAFRQTQISVVGITGTGQRRSFKQTVFADKSTCSVKIIAGIEDPAVIKNILACLDDNPTPLRVS